MNEIKCPKCGQLFQIDESNYENIVSQIRNHEFEKEVNEKITTSIALNNNEKDKVISDLKNQLINKENELRLRSNAEINKKDLEIQDLKNQIANNENIKKLEINEAVNKKENEISKLKAESESLKESYKKELNSKDELIAYYKDFKAKQSTKMIGENLEQHCAYEFNRVRPLFKNAYFEKDNDATSGSKGDFIFRDYDDEGTEIISIMFEMKNEADETASKHKNEDFFAKLDKDRNNKKCEYAVLVSLLEMDNDLYNEGIVDVSHKYNKMYVIRPQNFIPIITILRNAALNSLSYKKQLIIAQSQDVDLKNFEDNMNSFKEAFNKNYELASRKFNEAIEEIDKSISHLNKIKDALLSSDRNLRLANEKASDLTIKKLTKNAESILEKMGK